LENSDDLFHLINIQNGKALGNFERTLQAPYLLWMNIRAVIKVSKAQTVFSENFLEHTREEIPSSM
jgi:hypothetical protein